MLAPPTRPRSTGEAFELVDFDRGDMPPVEASIDRVLAQRVATAARVMAGVVLKGAAKGVKAVIHERGVWPSSECDRLWQDYAEANRARIDASSGAWVLSFRQDENEELVALLALVLLFGWGVVVASSDGTACVHLNHDGKVEMWSGDRGEMHAAAAELERMV